MSGGKTIKMNLYLKNVVRSCMTDEQKMINEQKRNYLRNIL